MAERLSEKIIFTVLLVLAWTVPSSHAGEFVKYTEARAQLDSKPAASGSVTADELQAMRQTDKVIVFDARSAAEFEHEHIAGAALPYADTYYKQVDLFRQKIVREAPNSRASLERSTRDLPRTATLVTYCSRNCGISKSLKMELERLGFTNVRWLSGGIDDWRDKGYPIEKK